MSSDINGLKRTLAERASSIAEHLLPGGKTIRDEYEVGDLNGGAGKSLRVHLRGPKAGLWSDFATGEGGDLLDLWMETKRLTLVEAMDEARSYLGLEKPRFFRGGERQWKRPTKPVCRAPDATGYIAGYLASRGISQDVMMRYQVAEAGSDIIFPFMHAGELIMAKRRPAVDGGKPMPTEGGCEKILFGWQAIPDNTRWCVLTEGEIDALSMAVYGYPAMSVPYGGGGGGKQDWIESEYDRMDRFEVIYLAMDNDEEGRAAVAEISSRLGAHRCRVVVLPRKDANKCLMDGVPVEDIKQAIEEAVTLDPKAVRTTPSYDPKVVELFYPDPDNNPGMSLPFSKVSGHVRFRPGELTLWAGESGSGKSMLLGQCICHWVSRQARVLLLSLEMAPPQTLKRMVKQSTGGEQPAKDIISYTLEWLGQGLLFFDHVGKLKVEEMLEVFDYCRSKYGTTEFVVDSLMRLGIKSDDYVGQEELVFSLVDWAIERQVHIHLVAHTRKAESKFSGPQSHHDVKGASEIVNNAFNILMVYRNRKREDVMADPNPSPEDMEKFATMPGVILNVVKQRNGDWEGRQGLWFNQKNYQYRDTVDPPMHTPYYVRMPQAAE